MMKTETGDSKHTSRLQQWLENIWYHKGAGKYLLLPLTALYCIVTNVQRRWQIRTLPRLDCPVIVVGNISVGGTGKTPLTLYLVKLLQRAGFKPGIITRGYTGKATRWPQAVTAESDTHLVGDEAVLMAARTQVPVVAGANRLKSIEQLMKDHDVNVIVSDDGMQHYSLPRDMQIAVIDKKRMLGNGYCLPAGPLRESIRRLYQCDFIVLNGTIVNDTNGHVENGLASVIDPHSVKTVHMQLSGHTLVNLTTGQQQDLSHLNGQPIHALCGMGNPQRFYTLLEEKGVKPITHSFPDHYQFKHDDLQFTDALPIVMTEKDAVKCKRYAACVDEKCWYLPVTAELANDFDGNFLTQLNRLIQGKKNG